MAETDLSALRSEIDAIDAEMHALLRRRAKRLRVLERQLPDAADMISRALRAGHHHFEHVGGRRPARQRGELLGVVEIRQRAAA